MHSDFNDRRVIRTEVGFDRKANAFLSTLTLRELTQFVGNDERWLEEAFRESSDISTTEMFAIMWCMDLLLTSDIVIRLQDIGSYLHDWFYEIQNLEGSMWKDLAKNDVDQLDTIYHFIQQQLTYMTELLKQHGRELK